MKGFTLIELLAVIVILAIILLIAMPIVLNVIAEARKGAFESSARGLIKTAENEYMKNTLSGSNEAKTYVFVDYEQIEGDLEYSGKGPRNGFIYVTSVGKVAAVLEDSTWLVKKELDEKDIVIEELEEQDIEEVFNEIIGTIYTVSYDANEGECVPSSREVIHGDTSTAPSCTREGYLLIDFERTVGSGGELNIETGAVTNVIGNQTITVNWEVDPCGGNSSIIDSRDEQTYLIVSIGEQCWFAENANYNVTGSACYDNSSANCDIYGRLYTFAQAISACPSGWSLPTDAQFYTLESNLATGTCNANRNTEWDCNPAGLKLKSVAWDGNNNSGFNALPAGTRWSYDGGFYHIGIVVHFWSSNTSGGSAYRRGLFSTLDTVHRDLLSQAEGFSVRCIKN